MKNLIILICFSLLFISCSSDAMLEEASNESQVVSIEQAVEDFDVVLKNFSFLTDEDDKGARFEKKYIKIETKVKNLLLASGEPEESIAFLDSREAFLKATKIYFTHKDI